MFKKMIISAALACAFCSASSAMAAWPVWDEFRNDALDNGRVVDKSDDRKVTTSEGQSYAMFFALVTNDQVTFDGLAAWTADNLSGGDLTKTLPAWLWGRGRGDKWGILDTNNATDSDMWIAWCFLEAGRLWKSEEYTKKGMAMLELLKKEVRTVDNLGSVVLPGFQKWTPSTVSPRGIWVCPLKTTSPGRTPGMGGRLGRWCPCCATIRSPSAAITALSSTANGSSIRSTSASQLPRTATTGVVRSEKTETTSGGP